VLCLLIKWRYFENITSQTKLSSMFRPYYHKTIFILFSFLAVLKTYAQTIPDSLLVYDRGYQLPKIRKEDKVSTPKLAMALTQNMSSDLEKFNALFHWVASTVTYDYNKASNMNGNVDAQLSDILRKEKAICIDYAQLMDSLCYYVGLPSVTVTGMTKGNGFSVNDPLFFDDHAWNAVRLAGEWYVYDVTWAAVSESYRFTRFSDWLLRLQSALYSETRTKKYRIDYEKQSASAIRCDIPKKQQDSVLFTYKDGIKVYEVFAEILSMIPKRVVLRKNKDVNSFYYLTDPDLFVTDHYPSNPIWTLSSRITSASAFSADSLYYYNSRITAYDQRRHGVKCSACDAYMELPQLEKLRSYINQSLRSNPTNFFETASGYFDMSFLFLRGDSIELGRQPGNLDQDSALLYLKLAEKDYRKCILAAGKLFKIQYKNNVLLKKHHAIHVKNTSAEIKHSFNKLRVAALNTTRFKKNLSSTIQIYEKEVKELKKLIDKPLPTRVLKPAVEKRQYVIIDKLTRANHEIDSKINGLISSISARSIDLVELLKTTNDSILLMNYCLDMDNYYRQFYLENDNDLHVKTNLRQLNRVKTNFYQVASIELTKQTEEFGESYNLLVKLQQERLKNVEKIAASRYALQANENQSETSFYDFISDEIEAMKDHYCQIYSSFPIYNDLIRLSFGLYGNKKETYSLLTSNLKAEQVRFKARNEGIRNDRKRTASIANTNIKLIKLIFKDLK